jgi:hypothetical protein
MKMLFALAAMIILVAAASGCVQTTGAGNGIVIESFRTDFSDVKSGEGFQIYLKFRNTGPFDAEHIKVTLMNVFNEDMTSVFTCSAGCRDIDKLAAAKPEQGTQGESMECVWSCDAPEDIPAGVKVAYNPRARISYRYRSNIARSITLSSQDEVKKAQDSGKTLPNDLVARAQGPVSLDMRFLSPVRYFRDQNRIVIPVSVDVSNSGSGTVCYPDCEDSDNWDMVSISQEYSNSDVSFSDCDVGDNSIDGYPIEIWQGKTRSIRCDIRIENMPEGFGFTRKTVNLKADYGYFVDAQTSFSVTGIENEPLI